jgi:hypothetical protein
LAVAGPLLSILRGKGAIGRRAFWIAWPLAAAPWIWIWFQPLYGCWALLAALYPTICLFSLRLRDAGFSGWWFAGEWLLLVVITYNAAMSHLVMRILALISQYPGGRGLFDIGPDEADLWSRRNDDRLCPHEPRYGLGAHENGRRLCGLIQRKRPRRFPSEALIFSANSGCYSMILETTPAPPPFAVSADGAVRKSSIR